MAKKKAAKRAKREAAGIPAPPPEFWTWLQEVARTLFANVCKPATPAEALASLHNPPLRGRLRAERGMRQKFQGAGRGKEWSKYGKAWMQQAYAQGQTLELIDAQELLA
jgi:hypothetical protein